MDASGKLSDDETRAWLRAALALQAEWGADEALLAEPPDRSQASRRPSTTASALPSQAAAARAMPAARPSATILPMAPGKVEAGTLAELRAALETFDQCALKRTATQLVFADGADHARVMIIGEAPGAEEDRVGRPFVGAAGRLLDRMLESIGLDRTTVRIVNVVPWRPPGNRTPSETEIAQCLPFLHRHIALTRPDCLLLLGAVAVRAVIGGKEGITRVRGKRKNVEIQGLDSPLPAFPTYHPAYLLRQPAAKRQVWLDLLTLWQECVKPSE